MTPDEITISRFRWNHRTQPEEAIDSLEPFIVHRIPRRALSLGVSLPRGQEASGALQRDLTVRVSNPRPARLSARLILDRDDARRFRLPRIFATGRGRAKRPGTVRLRLRLTDTDRLRTALRRRTPRLRLLRGRVEATALERRGLRINGLKENPAEALIADEAWQGRPCASWRRGLGPSRGL